MYDDDQSYFDDNTNGMPPIKKLRTDKNCHTIVSKRSGKMKATGEKNVYSFGGYTYLRIGKENDTADDVLVQQFRRNTFAFKEKNYGELENLLTVNQNKKFRQHYEYSLNPVLGEVEQIEICFDLSKRTKSNVLISVGCVDLKTNEHGVVVEDSYITEDVFVDPSDSISANRSKKTKRKSRKHSKKKKSRGRSSSSKRKSESKWALKAQEKKRQGKKLEMANKKKHGYPSTSKKATKSNDKNKKSSGSGKVLPKKRRRRKKKKKVEYFFCVILSILMNKSLWFFIFVYVIKEPRISMNILFFVFFFCFF